MTESKSSNTPQSAPPTIVCLSGNIAVGKSTLGKLVAERIGGAWLPETEITMQFPHLISENTPAAKLLAEIAIPSLRVAKVSSMLLSGSSLIVAERWLWEDRLFYDMWRDRLGLGSFDRVFQELFEIFETKVPSFTLLTFILDCSTKDLSRRARQRNKPYDHLFTDSVINDLQVRYDWALQVPPPHVVRRFDVTDLDLRNASQVDSIVSSITDEVQTRTRIAT